ncbi:tripartite motif-containing protein 14-like [Acipenser ruthenus]|uniref:tripartite motif-containing protein 14-like n=1 Tax=Acipenser ruthenus TaxID=7906 RepID=UPI0027405618|nr:tripartite motif-containing protein 14-like [Acipenser ruthenus]
MLMRGEQYTHPISPHTSGQWEHTEHEHTQCLTDRGPITGETQTMHYKTDTDKQDQGRHRTCPHSDQDHTNRDARSPTLEPDILHPRLRLSESRETVSCGWLRKSYPDGPLRFDKLWQVLSRDSFFAGRHYWEVDLHRACKGWWIGAAYRSMSRKGDTEASRLGWNRGSWCMKRFDLEYWAFHNGTRTLVLLEEDTDRIGVFLDYEAGTLSFFDTMYGMRHLYTFKANFTEPVYPALRLWEGAITFCKLT